MSGHRTPTWWRSLPTWSQVVILSLLLPGVVAHELTHLLVAAPWSDGESRLDWDAIAVELSWASSSPAPRVAAHIAPLVAGYAAGVGAVAIALGMPGFSMHFGVLAYVAVNWLLYTVASVSDLEVAREYFRFYRQSQLPE